MPHKTVSGALARARRLIDRPAAPAFGTPGGDWRVTDLTVRFADRSSDAGSSHQLRYSPRTHHRAAGGQRRRQINRARCPGGQLASGDDVVVTGSMTGMGGAHVAWLPQHPRFVGESVRGELQLYADDDGARSAGRIGELLRELDLDEAADESPEQLSPGEARRLAIARTFLRIDAGATLVLLDEPTAHLDQHSAEVVQRMIALAAGTNHGRPGLPRPGGQRSRRARGAHRRTVRLPTGIPRNRHRVAGADAGPRASRRAEHHAAGSRLRVAVDVPAPRGRQVSGRYRARHPRRALRRLHDNVSGWLIVKASEHPSIMYLSVAIVGVRFFGIGRSALHYAERLITHDAVLDSVTTLRLRMWRAFIGRGATSRKMLGGASVLDNLVGAADHVRDLAPRVVIPASVAVLTSGSVVIAVDLLDSAALPLIVGCLLLCLIVAPIITIVADRAATRSAQRAGSRVLRQFAAMLAAAADLRANGIAPRIRRRLAAEDHAAGLSARRSSGALGLGSALIVLTCCATAVLTFTVSADQVREGTLPIELVAVLAFLPLALIDCLLASTEAIQQWPALSFQLGRINAVLDEHRDADSEGEVDLERPQRLDLRGVGARWPHAEDETISGVELHASRGQWVVVTGPSGSGKSTLLTVLLGYLAVEHGTYTINGLTQKRCREGRSAAGSPGRHRTATSSTQRSAATCSSLEPETTCHRIANCMRCSRGLASPTWSTASNTASTLSRSGRFATFWRSTAANRGRTEPADPLGHCSARRADRPPGRGRGRRADVRPEERARRQTRRPCHPPPRGVPRRRHPDRAGRDIPARERSSAGLSRTSRRERSAEQLRPEGPRSSDPKYSTRRRSPLPRAPWRRLALR